MTPLVSVVIITFNSGKYIIETLESVKAQTYQNLELIISDDCSNDNTVPLCEQWLANNQQRFTRFRIITVKQNTGIAANLNRAIKSTTGEWIKGLAGDDLLFPHSIENYITEALKPENTENLVYHSRVKVIYDDDSPLIKGKFGQYGSHAMQKFNQPETTANEQFSILLRFCPIVAPTNFYKKEIFDKVGYFSERYMFWEDRPMWLNITSHGIKINFINQELVIYRQHIGSVQKRRQGNMFSRTEVSIMHAHNELIAPHLPADEQKLCNYLFRIKRFFYKTFNNKSNLMLSVLYKILTTRAEQKLAAIKTQYKP